MSLLRLQNSLMSTFLLSYFPTFTTVTTPDLCLRQTRPLLTVNLGFAYGKGRVRWGIWNGLLKHHFEPENEKAQQEADGNLGGDVAEVPAQTHVLHLHQGKATGGANAEEAAADGS